MAGKKGVVVTEEGREYKTVAARIDEFRAKYPLESGWSIVTQIQECSEKQVLCKATIVNAENRIVATGHAQETWDSGQFNSTSAVEICETSAIGRALAIAGFVGVELEIASADEIEQAKKAQRAGKTNKPKADKTKAKGVVEDVVPVFDEGTVGRFQDAFKKLGEITDLTLLESECNIAANQLRQLRSITPADKQNQLIPLVDMLVEYKRKIDAGRAE